MNAQIPLEKTGVTSRLRATLIGGGALVLLYGGYWYFNHESATRPVRSTAIPVRVAQVTRHDMPVVEHTLGTVVAYSVVQISARVTGIIDTASFKKANSSRRAIFFSSLTRAPTRPPLIMRPRRWRRPRPRPSATRNCWRRARSRPGAG